ncbi:MAG: hypothetical protein ABI707_14865 [Ferruginibacter sp.]
MLKPSAVGQRNNGGTQGEQPFVNNIPSIAKDFVIQHPLLSLQPTAKS